MAYPIFTGCGRSRRRPILLETSSAKERHRKGACRKKLVKRPKSSHGRLANRARMNRAVERTMIVQ